MIEAIAATAAVNAPSALDQALIPALRKAIKIAGESWREVLQAHRGHPGFRTTQNPQRRTLGFICNCSGIEVEQSIDIRELKELLPEARLTTQRIFQEEARKGMKAKRRKARRAVKRSEALLYRYLTKEQKWSFRASKFFTVRGKDGHDYEIHGFFGNNVYRYDKDGKRRYRFCVVVDYKTPVPVFDLMLAQKLKLETNPREFLDMAVVHDDIEGDWWSNGKHIDNPDVEPVESNKQKVAAWRALFQQENFKPKDEDLERIEHLQAEEHLNKLAIVNLLLPDVGMTDRVQHVDVSEREVAFVMDENLDVVPTYDAPCEVPKLDDQDHESRILKMITGVPAAVYKSIASVQAHFRACDLCGVCVLVHPETDSAWSARVDPIWHDGARILGVRKIKDERVPKGRAWYVADAETVGFHVQWMDSPHRGYIIYNLNGVAIYAPPDNHDEAALQEEVDEARHARITTIYEEAAEEREEVAGRLLQGQGIIYLDEHGGD